MFISSGPCNSSGVAAHAPLRTQCCVVVCTRVAAAGWPWQGFSQQLTLEYIRREHNPLPTTTQYSEFLLRWTYNLQGKIHSNSKFILWQTIKIFLGMLDVIIVSLEFCHSSWYFRLNWEFYWNSKTWYNKISGYRGAHSLDRTPVVPRILLLLCYKEHFSSWPCIVSKSFHFNSNSSPGAWNHFYISEHALNFEYVLLLDLRQRSLCIYMSICWEKCSR